MIMGLANTFAELHNIDGDIYEEIMMKDIIGGLVIAPLVHKQQSGYLQWMCLISRPYACRWCSGDVQNQHDPF